MNLRSRSLLPSFGLLAAALAGCSTNSSTPVSIDYRQIGFCNSYAVSGAVRAAKPGEVYVVYKIDAVDNAQRSAEFTFFPTRLYIDPAEWGEAKTLKAAKPGEMQEAFALRDRRRFVSNDASFAQSVHVAALQAGVVAGGAKKTLGGYAIVATPTSFEDRPVEHAFKLSYEPQTGEAVDPPVVMSDADAGKTSWPHPENCQELPLDRLP